MMMVPRYDLHGVDFMGERVTCELAKGTPHGRDKDRLEGYSGRILPT